MCNVISLGALAPNTRDGTTTCAANAADAAADRFAAAAVLYHSLTGIRPAQDAGPGVDEAILVDAERFDAGVRDQPDGRGPGRPEPNRGESGTPIPQPSAVPLRC